MLSRNRALPGAVLMFAVSAAASQESPRSTPSDPVSCAPAAVEREARLVALERQVQELRQMVTQLLAAREVPTAPGRLDVAAAAPPVLRAGRDGFGLRSADGEFSLRLWGYAHADTRLLLGRPPAADQFVLRRVRPNVEGTMFRQFAFRIVPDLGEGKVVLQDAFVDTRFTGWFQLRAGKFKAPAGLERLVSATNLPFVERAFPTGLVPNRDIGLMVHGDSRGGRFSYAAGVFNGVPDGGSADGDDHDGKDFAGRVFVLPLKPGGARQTVGLGLSVTAGVQQGTAAAPSLPTYKSNGQQTIFRYRTELADLGPSLASGARYRWSAQGYYYNGPAGVLVEHVVSTQQVRRGSAGLRARNSAFQVQSSFVLTGERASYTGVVPARVFDSARGTWGAFEVVGRLQRLAIDRRVFPYFADPATSVSGATAAGVGLNWYLNGGVKIATDYDRTAFDAAGAARRPAAHDVLSRIQFSF